MRLYTLNLYSGQKLAMDVDGGVCLLHAICHNFKDMNELIEKATPELLAEIKADGEGIETFPFDFCKIGAPIPKPKQDIICLGVNYKAHADECNIDTEETVYFSKRVNEAVGHKGNIQSHSDIVDSLDYEVELGVIIGKEAYKVKAEDAEDYIFGYTIINDVSARNLQFKHKQWYFGKSLDGFTPMGPCIVTKDEIKDVQNLDVKCYVNGELRQHSNTSKMIKTVAGAIEELSAGMTLQPGTIIATGTPSGVALGMEKPNYLKKGDVVRCEIEGIGVLENTVV
jgi:2-keto-4-pentenoate hydratase/2-oxohepta-3-ene-1,7-dioic acid hydratase in catechol pathway